MHVDLRIDTRWLLPMTDDAPVLENHSVFVTDGRIVLVQPTEVAGPEAAERIVLDQHALLPGYINAHGHAAMSLFRGLADDLPLMTWLQDHIWPSEAKWVDSAFVYQGTQLAIAEMLRCGTTTFADMYFYSSDSIDAALNAGIRTVSFTPVLDFPTNFAQNADEYIRKTMDVHNKYRHQPLAHIGIGPHAPYTVSDGPLKEIAALANQTGMPVQIHLHETAFEVQQSIEERGIRPTQRLAELGFLNESVSCVHMTQIDETDIKLLQQTGASVVHCPESNLKLASGFCPIENLTQAGVNVGIGTDGAASNNDLNIQGEMKTAAMLAKAVANDAAALNAMSALKMATINSARALRIDDVTGSIEVGKFADLQAVRLDSLTQTPIYDPASQLVYTDSSRYTEYTWVAGKALLHSGRLTSIDEKAVIENARLWQNKIQP
ncbi:TRZ/ATZ family hydrolase [Thalassolituus sp.]|uniref:TRZ/ATZ family hydrolase n=1 Tax=Thalassolituus sp. TaxID=2030822 RepID=UPI003514606D